MRRARWGGEAHGLSWPGRPTLCDPERLTRSQMRGDPRLLSRRVTTMATIGCPPPRDGAGGGAPGIHRRLAPFAPFARFLERKGWGGSWQIFFSFLFPKEEKVFGGPRDFGVRQRVQTLQGPPAAFAAIS